MKSTLSPAATTIISHFENLQIGGKKIRCPYFNNKRAGKRASLSVLTGKGRPQDIEEEAHILAQRERINLSIQNEEQVRAFLVDHELGIECSGFAYHVLAAEQKSKGKSIRSIVPHSTGFIRKLIARWRHLQNVNVKAFADEKNSSVISLSNVQAGDIITMLGTGDTHDLDHILIVSEVDEKTLHYIHALNWKSDGKYNHGIRRGSITINKKDGALTEQTWQEDGKTGKENETYFRASTANALSLRRLK